MNTPRDIAIPLQRITWRDGQTLQSRDLRDDVHYDDRLRHLHIRYLHRIWGIVEGLDVIALGSTAVLVGPGYALDVEGCELLRPSAIRLATPVNIVASVTMYLVLSRGLPAGACTAPLDLATLCTGTRNAVPIEQGELGWKTVGEVRPGIDILLARVLIAGGHLASALDTSIQHRAATMDQSRIWSDTTPQGQTGWTNVSTGNLREIEAIVDTSDAGFIATPAYFAQLGGPAQMAGNFIASAARDSFRFVVRLGDVQASESSSWTITWFAVELPPKPAEPFASLSGRLR